MNYSPTSLAYTGVGVWGLLQVSLALFVVGIAIMTVATLIPKKDKS